jgi:hypothetical protein
MPSPPFSPPAAKGFPPLAKGFPPPNAAIVMCVWVSECESGGSKSLLGLRLVQWVRHWVVEQGEETAQRYSKAHLIGQNDTKECEWVSEWVSDEWVREWNYFILVSKTTTINTSVERKQHTQHSANSSGHLVLYPPFITQNGTSIVAQIRIVSSQWYLLYGDVNIKGVWGSVACNGGSIVMRNWGVRYRTGWHSSLFMTRV